jgi:uracil-DNA glycosylase
MTMMPEGPEVRTLADQLRPAIGRRLVKVEFVSGRYSLEKPPTGYDPEFFDNTIVTEWNCKGKFMYVQLRSDNSPIIKAADHHVDDEDYQLSIWITLGMTGRFLNEAAHQAAVTAAAAAMTKSGPSAAATAATTNSNVARWYLEFQDQSSPDGILQTSRIYYHDPRSFGTLKFCTSRMELAAKLAALGPDILSESFTEGDFVSIVSSTRPSTNICRFLMDQSKVSGVGNYLLAEGLYKANVDPFCSLDELSNAQQGELFRALQDTALHSYRAQGMTRGTAGKYRTLEGEPGTFEFQLCCYGRQRCRLRNDPVRQELNGPHGRTIWYTDAQLFKPRSERSALLSSISTVSARTTRSADAMEISSEPAVTTGAASKRKNGPASSISADGGANEVSNKKSSSSSTSGAVDWVLKGLVEPSWKRALADHLASESFRQLAEFVDREYRSDAGLVYPPRQEIFAALNAVPVEGVRVVIVGQDPYHGPGQAHGLAFSVPKRVRPPPSLQNVLRELNDDLGMSDPPKHGCLTPWASQGVLLLNTVLTVRAGEAFSHANHGWEEFTDAVLETVVEKHSERGVVFLLWGNPAQAKARRVPDDSAHCIIKTSHPSPLGARKTASPFLGSRCFSRANAALIQRNYDPIDWTLS